MRRLNTQNRGFAREWSAYLAAASAPRPKIIRTVAAIIRGVQKRGDKALFAYTKRFDRCALSARTVRISERKIETCLQQVPAAHLRLLRRAAQRIRRFHQQQKTRDWSLSHKGARMGLRGLA